MCVRVEDWVPGLYGGTETRPSFHWGSRAGEWCGEGGKGNMETGALGGQGKLTFNVRVQGRGGAEAKYRAYGRYNVIFQGSGVRQNSAAG